MREHLRLGTFLGSSSGPGIVVVVVDLARALEIVLGGAQQVLGEDFRVAASEL